MTLKKWEHWSRVAKWSAGLAAATIVSASCAFDGGGGPCGMGAVFFYLGVLPFFVATCITGLIWIVRSITTATDIATTTWACFQSLRRYGKENGALFVGVCEGVPTALFYGLPQVLRENKQCKGKGEIQGSLHYGGKVRRLRSR